ncbi:MAG: hypothetical protein K5853_08060, partial [Lachnospiraceae bacterium]|nr:hypothetical protein [Lachnospiraceae bacterium]
MKTKPVRRALGIASTPYHLMVFLFLKDAFLTDYKVDLLLTDKTASLKELYDSGRAKDCFDTVFYANGKCIKNPYKNGMEMLYESMIKNPEYDRLFEDRPAPELSGYSDIFFASPGMPDEISKEIIKTAILKNRQVRFHRFEDGFASYTKPPVSSVTSDLGRILYRIGKGFDIKKAENRLYLFEPRLAERAVADQNATGFQLRQIPNNDVRIRRVTEQIRHLFLFESRDFEEPFLFLGQGTDNVTQNPETYASLIREIAEKVGYANFCMKPHPRGT